MLMPVTELPKEYLPFEELEMCSNRFVNGKVLIEAHNHAVLLIGKGPQPVVWLSGLISKEGKQFQEIVNKNCSLNKRVDVIISEKNNSTIIKVGDLTIVEVAKASESKAIIPKMDLRPLGLNIYGDTKELHVGTNRLIGSTFMNTHTMVGIGN